MIAQKTKSIRSLEKESTAEPSELEAAKKHNTFRDIKVEMNFEDFHQMRCVAEKK